LPQAIQRPALRRLTYLHAAKELADLLVPPSNHLEALSGARSGQYIIRIKDGKPMPMSYYQAPGEALDNPDEMVEWADKAYAAALRAQSAKPKRRKKGG
jgi:plasmid maintenance system killer protein